MSQDTLGAVQTKNLKEYLACAPADEMGLLANVPRFSTPHILAERLGFSPTEPLLCSGLANILDGRRADGKEIAWQKSRRPFGKSGETPRRVAYLGTAFSADKSVSVAWAATDGAESAMIVYAHQRAVQIALPRLEWLIGRARRGRDGSGGFDQVPITWLASAQYTARPTQGARGKSNGKFGKAHNFRYIAGDPQLHSHVMIPNVAVAEDGRTVALDLRLAGHIHSIGALYQAAIATELRRAGATVELDVETGAARLMAIPDHVRTTFSKRVQDGELSARAYAADHGLEWDGLSSAQRAGLIKSGTQGDPHGARSDDIGNQLEWHRQAAALGWHPGRMLDPSKPVLLEPREIRIQKASAVASELILKAIKDKGAFDEAELWTVAARGLVSAGLDTLQEIDAVAESIAGTGILSEKQTGRTLVVSSVVHGRARRSFVTVTDQKITSEAIPVALVRDGTAAKRIEAMRRLGSAVLMQGSSSAVIDQVVDLWTTYSQNHPVSAIVVVPTPMDAYDVSRAIRQRRCGLGEIDVNEIICKAIDETGLRLDLSLAAGDRVRLHAHTNALSADGRRGIIGRAGSIVTITNVGKEGIGVSSASGRLGTIAWDTLRDWVSGRARLTYADAVPAIALPTVNSLAPCYILALPNGLGSELISESLRRWWRHGCQAVAVRGAQQSHEYAAGQGDDPSQSPDADVWARLAEALESTPQVNTFYEMIVTCEANRHEAQWAALKAMHSLESGQRLGLETTLQNRLYHLTNTVIAGQIQCFIQPALDIRRSLIPLLDRVAGLMDAELRGGAASLVARLQIAAQRHHDDWLLQTTLSRRLLMVREEGDAGVGRSLVGAPPGHLKIKTVQEVVRALEGGIHRTAFFFGQEFLTIARARRVAWIRDTTLAKRFQTMQWSTITLPVGELQTRTAGQGQLLKAVARTQAELDAVMSAGLLSALKAIAARRRKREPSMSQGDIADGVPGFTKVVKTTVSQWFKDGLDFVSEAFPSEKNIIIATSHASPPLDTANSAGSQENLDWAEAFRQVYLELGYDKDPDDQQRSMSMKLVQQRADAIRLERDTRPAGPETDEVKAERWVNIKRRVRIPELVIIEENRLVQWKLVVWSGENGDRAVFITTETEWMRLEGEGLRGLGRDLGLDHGAEGVSWADWNFGTIRVDVERKILAKKIAERFTVCTTDPGKLKIHRRLYRAKQTIINENRLVKHEIARQGIRRMPPIRGEGR